MISEDKIREPDLTEEEIDYDVMGTFPCSDPPSWTLGRDCREQTETKHKRRTTSVNEPSHQHDNTASV